MGRARSSSGIRGSTENCRIRWKSSKAKVVHDVVSKYASFICYPLLNGLVDLSGVPQEVIKALSILNAKDVWEQGMVTEIISNRGVIDDSFNTERIEIIAVSNSRELEDLGGTNRPGTKKNLLYGGHHSPRGC